MKFWVPLSTAEEIVAVFQKRLKFSSLPGVVTMTVRPGENAFAVTLRSGRVSVLSFLVTSEDSGATVTLVDKEVSRAHHTFITDLSEWIYHHARAIGGRRTIL